MAINLSPQKGINLNPAAYRSETRVRSANFSLTEVVLLVIMIGLFSWYMVLPKQAGLKTKQAQIKQLQDSKNKIQSEIDGLNASINTLNDSKSQVTDLDEALPLDSRTTKLQMLMEAIASQAGVALESVNFDLDSKAVYATDPEAVKNPFTQPRSLKTIKGSVAVLGTYDQIQAFLEKIEHSQRLLQILTMDLNLQQDNVMSLKLDLEAFSYE